MLFVGLVMMGLFSYRYLPMELYPNEERPELSVRVSYRNGELDPTYAETQVAIPVEGSINSLPGVEEISTVVSPNYTQVTASFSQDINIKYAQLQLEEKIRMLFASSALSDEFTARVNAAGGMTGGSQAFMLLRVLGDGDIDYVRNLTDKEVLPQLQTIDGIADVTARGGRQWSIEIIVDPYQLEALGIQKSQISRVVQQNSMDRSFVGTAVDGALDYFVNVTAEYYTPEDIENIVVKADGPILLGDIATVNFGIKEPDSYSRTNGKEQVSVILTRSPASNSIDLSARVRKEIEELNLELAEKGLVVEVTSDESEMMSDNIDTIINLALTGALLAIFILYLFLRKLRIVSIVTFAIPISIFSSFYFFYLSGVTINILTLTGIALAVGMLLDNSIVVMENIYRLKAQGHDNEEASVRGVKEVWKSILASTLTTVTVFLPFLFAEEQSIKLIGQHIGISIIVTLTVSLVVALLLIPMAMNWLLKRRPEDVNFNNLSIHNRLVQIYMALVKMALRKPSQVIFGSLVVLLVTVLLSQALTLNVSKEIETDTFTASVTTPSGYTLDRMDEEIRRFEEEIQNIEEIKEFTSNITVDENSSSSLRIVLKEDFNKINRKSLSQLRDELQNIAKRINLDMTISSSASSSNSASAQMGGGRNRGMLQMMGMGTQQEYILIKGEDYEEMVNFGEYLKYQMDELENVSSSRLSTTSASREARIYFDQYLMGINDITTSNVMSSMNNNRPQSSTGGTFKTKDGQEYEIMIQDIDYDPNDITTQMMNLEDLRNTSVETRGGGAVELRNVSQLKLESGRGTIRRLNQAKDLTLTYAFVSDINENKSLLEAARDEIDELVQNQDIPMGIALEVIHEEEKMDDFTFFILMAFLLIYMILASVFESLTAPVVLMFTIPLAAIGSLLALLLTSNAYDNYTVYMGFIILIGIVVNNSIILVDYTSLLRRQGNRKERAILTAGIYRLRPILITAITTIVAMLPLALGQGELVSGIGAPFAITVVGGLAMSTLLTLVIIPTLYSGMEDALNRIGTQSLFMKILQGVLVVFCLTCTYLFADGMLETMLFALVSIVGVPAVTWFLESSLRRAKSNIIPPDQELVINISNLVKIYGRPSLFKRELASGQKIRERLGLKVEYKTWREMQPLTWLIPILVGMYWFTFWYQTLFLWAVFFGFITYLLTLTVLDMFTQLAGHKGKKLIRTILFWTATVFYYGAPVVILWWSSGKFFNSGGAIFIGLFWYTGILAKYLSDKINKENINIDLISGRFRMLRKTIYRTASKIPVIGVKPKPFKALSSVSMEIRPGMFGLLGPNGAGKTTLMRIICGVFEQSYGKIFINGIDTQKKREELQGLIGYLPQEFGTYENLTAWEFLEYQALLKGIYDKRTRHTRIDEVLGAVHMYENKDKKIGSFSGGMKQRIGIAQTLLNLPRILVVDEPTAGLDPRERIRFRNLLVELSRNRIVIFSTHIIEDIASSCNQVGVINKGELKYLGTPTDMADIAREVTWSFEIPVRDFGNLPSDLLIVHHIRQGEMIKVRCLSERKPTEDAVHITPALEDSYLWLLRTVKIKGNEEIIT